MNKRRLKRHVRVGKLNKETKRIVETKAEIGRKTNVYRLCLNIRRERVKLADAGLASPELNVDPTCQLKHKRQTEIDIDSGRQKEKLNGV